MIICSKAYPRVGLIGNPSDGYFGKTISFAFGNFCAEVVLYETPELEILPSEKDHSRFNSITDIVKDVNLHGYYGGIRLLKATIKKFHDYCREHQIELHKKNFTIRYASNIPHSVGLAGSSAIITGCLRALSAFYGVSIPKYIQANLILSAEVDELHISAGLQDRVIQVYEGLVYMDFSKEIMDRQGYGVYEPLDPELLPKLYVAYREDLSEPTEIFHNNIRERFRRGEQEVVDAMQYWAELAVKLRSCLLNRQTEKISDLLNANFDQRRKIYRISDENIQMVETARSVGASAKFTGSGGAIVGTYENDQMFDQLREKLRKLKIKVIKPKIVNGTRKAET
ncbi:MAG: GHMP kinase [Phycisphaerae bacterium]|nr:GHMP kinase [Phycisphaerae bacterium]MDD5381439.1 GHMP kinase [Phycisphaerae bacterium]